MTHDFAKASELTSKKIVFRRDVLGSLGEAQDGVYYMFDMVLNYGSVRKVWAYGINSIMGSPESLDLTCLRSLFPHIPKEVFAPTEKKHVDILMGNNFLGLHPNAS